MVTGQPRRFVAQAALVARVYAGYKLLQTLGRLGIGRSDATWKSHHRSSAEAVYRLATRLEGLPIKVCQFLGSRADILPDEYVEVLSRLQDKVPPRPFDALVPQLRDELGKPVEKAFARIDETPIAAASLAQVHRARLHDGREVAVKIQYPEIAQVVRDDIQNFGLLLRVLARLEPNFDFRVLLNEVTKLVPLELDFLNEAKNAERMARHLHDTPDVSIPTVVHELSSSRVLVTEFAEGVRLTDLAGMRAMGVEPRAIARRLSELFAEMILVHGFFHGDPHPGNILVQRGGKLVLLDFGLAKALPPDFREGIVRLTMCIMGGDKSQIAAAFRALGFRTREESDESLAVLGEAFLGFALRNGRAFADRDIIAQFNDDVPRAMKANPLVEIPGDILLVGRVMGILSGVGKQLGSDVDPAALLMPFLAGSPPATADGPPA